MVKMVIPVRMELLVLMDREDQEVLKVPVVTLDLKESQEHLVQMELMDFLVCQVLLEQMVMLEHQERLEPKELLE